MKILITFFSSIIQLLIVSYLPEKILYLLFTPSDSLVKFLIALVKLLILIVYIKYVYFKVNSKMIELYENLK